MRTLSIAEVSTPSWGIDDMPNLKASLGKSASDRIRMHQLNKPAVGGPRTRWVNNPHKDYIDDQPTHGSGPVDDILSGIAALSEDKETRLSAGRLYTLLALNNRVSTELICVGLQVDARQGRRYMAACKLAIFHITRHRNTQHDELQELLLLPATQA